MPARPSFSFPGLVAPVKGAQGILVPLDFTGGITSIPIDFALEQSNGVIDFFQSFYADNKDNAQALTFTFGGSGYVVRVRAAQQGIYPIIVPDGVMSVTINTTGGIRLNVIFMNVALPPMTWGL